MRMRKKKNLIPRMDRCGERLIREPYERVGVAELMPAARELGWSLLRQRRFTPHGGAEPDGCSCGRWCRMPWGAMERCVAED